MAASTCIVDGLISTEAAGIDTLRLSPAVFISLAGQRPNRQTSPLFSADASRAPHRAEVTYKLGGHTNRSGKADPACNIAVGS